MKGEQEMKKHRTPEIFREKRKTHNRYHNILFKENDPVTGQYHEGKNTAYREFWKKAAAEIRLIKFWKEEILSMKMKKKAYYAAKQVLLKHESNLTYYKHEIHEAQRYMTEI